MKVKIVFENMEPYYTLPSIPNLLINGKFMYVPNPERDNLKTDENGRITFYLEEGLNQLEKNRRPFADDERYKRNMDEDRKKAVGIINNFIDEIEKLHPHFWKDAWMDSYTNRIRKS